MATVSGTKNYTVIAVGSSTTTINGTKKYTVAAVGSDTVNGTVSYVITSPAFNKTGKTNYTVVKANSVVNGLTTYTVIAPQIARAYMRSGATLSSIRIGKRRGSSIDWLTPSL